MGYDGRPLVFATVQGDIDLSTPAGRTMARVMVAFANKASMDLNAHWTLDAIAAQFVALRAAATDAAAAKAKAKANTPQSHLTQ